MPKIIKNGKEFSGVPLETLTAWPDTGDRAEVAQPLMGNTSLSGIGDGTVTGAIATMKDIVGGDYSAEVIANTETIIATAVVPKTGKWLFLSYMKINKDINSVYNHRLSGRTVRSTSIGGGGSLNWIVVNAPESVTIRAYTTVDCTVSGQWTAIRLN